MKSEINIVSSVLNNMTDDVMILISSEKYFISFSEKKIESTKIEYKIKSQ